MMTRRELLATAAAGFAATKLFGSTPIPRTLDLIPGDVCTLTCAQTLGPCHYDPDFVRRDITEGKAGLPTLLSFLVVDANTCEPIPNAAVEVWHTDVNGVYSAPIATMCNPGDALARQQTFLRGIQTTDANGWAYFNSVYPGWYSGRTPHIHAMIGRNGSTMVTTQFYFEDAMSDWVYRNHPLYTHRPNRNTTNTTDNVIGGSATRVNPFLFRTKLIEQRALVALKVVAIRDTRTTCNA